MFRCLCSRSTSQFTVVVHVSTGGKALLCKQKCCEPQPHRGIYVSEDAVAIHKPFLIENSVSCGKSFEVLTQMPGKSPRWSLQFRKLGRYRSCLMVYAVILSSSSCLGMRRSFSLYLCHTAYLVIRDVPRNSNFKQPHLCMMCYSGNLTMIRKVPRYFISGS